MSDAVRIRRRGGRNSIKLKGLSLLCPGLFCL